MQLVDAATTMGIIFGCMGVGAFLGPIAFNCFTPPQCDTTRIEGSLDFAPPTPRRGHT